MKLYFNYLFVLVLPLFIFSCNNENQNNYVPKNLRILSSQELLNRAKKDDRPNMDSIVYKDSLGNIVPIDSLITIPNLHEWTVDRYVNENGKIREFVLRKATLKDIEIEADLNKLYAQHPTTLIEVRDVDCGKLNEILLNVYNADQNMRQSNEPIDANVDRENLAIVISIIEKCGVSTLSKVGENQMSAIWLVLQHSEYYYINKYFSIIESLVENGHLLKSNLALMQDRKLLFENKPQIYGSQISKNPVTGEYELYNLMKPEGVNERRKQMGLGPIEEYLSIWDIKFEPETSKTLIE